MDLHSPTYLYERTDWPRFRWDPSAVQAQIAAMEERQRLLLAAMGELGFEARQETVLSVLVQEVQKSSEIEGELLDGAQVRSSVARRLGMDAAGLPRPARNVEGTVEMTMDASLRYTEPLTAERLFGWHAALFPTGRSGMAEIAVGKWREGAMPVLSGPMGRERVHFEAPPPESVEAEMRTFLDWFENEPVEPMLKAAIAHLWFVTIHPFEDGNGRIGRAIVDLALARFDRTEQRFYSMSAQIHEDKEAYYDILERTQKASMDVTQWVQWFLGRLERALRASEGVLEVVGVKTRFWQTHAATPFNDRQRKVLNRLLDGFEGKLRTSKYAAIAKCSPDTALRDLGDLVAKGALEKDESSGGGRSTSYILAPQSADASSVTR
ncbi:Fic family protein [bacterium]|nr:MAG: Fic family protein [bacterium]